MTKTIRENLKRLNDNTIRSTAMSNLIAQKTAEFDKSIQPYHSSIERFDKESDQIMQTDVFAALGDILNRLAHEWGVEMEDLDVTYRTNYDYKTCSITPAEASAKRFNNRKEKGGQTINIVFNIASKDGKTARFSGTINTSLKLADGSRVHNYVQAKAVDTLDGNALVKIAILDFDSIILTYQLSDLVRQTENGIEPRSKLANTVIASVDKYETDRQKSLTK